MVRKVVIAQELDVVLTTEATKENGYVMKGNKGDYILARDTEGRYIFVKANGITKPVKSYGTIQEALEDKLKAGYEVFEFTDVDFE